MIEMIDKIIVENKDGRVRLQFRYKILHSFWEIVEKYDEFIF